MASWQLYVLSHLIQLRDVRAHPGMNLNFEEEGTLEEAESNVGGEDENESNFRGEDEDESPKPESDVGDDKAEYNGGGGEFGEAGSDSTFSQIGEVGTDQEPESVAGPSA